MSPSHLRARAHGWMSKRQQNRDTFWHMTCQKMSKLFWPSISDNEQESKEYPMRRSVMSVICLSLLFPCACMAQFAVLDAGNLVQNTTTPLSMLKKEQP